MRRILIAVLILILAGSLVVERIDSHDHEKEHGQTPQHWWTRIPGFFMFFGFLGCAALIALAKSIGKIFLLKDEDYYHDQ